MSNLRSKLIRLAYERPELRGTLIPLLTSNPVEKTSSKYSTWSVAMSVDDGYVDNVRYFDSEHEAKAYAKRRGDSYVIEGTQMRGKPLGEIEESDRYSGLKYFP